MGMEHESLSAFRVIERIPDNRVPMMGEMHPDLMGIQRGKDFINKLLEMYNINTNNDKNEVAQKTAEFINERISIISKELGSTEKDLESFKRGAGITDLTSDAQIALTGSAEYEKKRVENQPSGILHLTGTASPSF